MQELKILLRNTNISLFWIEKEDRGDEKSGEERRRLDIL